MGIPFLNSHDTRFPDVHLAMEEPNGLLAAGGDLSPERLLSAYSRGIFPWYNEFLEDGSPSPILWWCPQPRCVVNLAQLDITRSLKKTIRNGDFDVSCNQCFQEVIEACSADRAKAEGTWINKDIQHAYYELHKLGYAHSIECWHKDLLIGGLYGVSIGKVFFGESMFSRKSNASKIAFVYLSSLLKQQGAQIIDCQIANPHLMSLGAIEIGLEKFLKFLESDCQETALSFPKEKHCARNACAIFL